MNLGITSLLPQFPQQSPESMNNPGAAPASGLSDVKTQAKGKLDSFLSLPDKHPKLKIVFDVGIIALAVISIITTIVMSGGQGLMLYALIPSVLFAGLGLALLLSDLVKKPKAQAIVQKTLAVLTPILLVSAGAALIVAACYTGGFGVMLATTPQFFIGMILIGLAMISIKQVTLKAFKGTQSTGTQSRKTVVQPKIDSKNHYKEMERRRKQRLDKQIRENLSSIRLNAASQTTDTGSDSDGLLGSMTHTRLQPNDPPLIEEASYSIIRSHSLKPTIPGAEENSEHVEEVTTTPSPSAPLFSVAATPTIQPSTSSFMSSTESQIKPVTKINRGQSSSDNSEEKQENQQQQKWQRRKAFKKKDRQNPKKEKRTKS
ncbi:MAG: IncV family inclusion membrane protein [Victivallaceae bacterium]